MELIDKSKLLEELKRCEKICEDYASSHKDAVSQGIANAKRTVCQHFIKFLNTLETKEVDLDVMQRMEECPYRRVGCTMYADKILDCNGTCSWVVDYPKVK